MCPLSILDLVPVPLGGTPADALQNSLALARTAERAGYTRYWVAEHHNMTGIASAATSVVIGYLAAGTTTLRLGAGGVMLPNHSPLVIAEQFGTLESLYPGRIDLGLGRAPGTDGHTALALRRDPHAADTFAEDVQELQALFEPVREGQKIRAVPGAGLRVPLWILGSSLYGAQLAAALGLPYAFASHFAPPALHQALQVYRNHFRASARWPRPHAMVGVNVIAAETDDEARYLFTSQQQVFTNMVRNQRGLFPPPIDDIDDYWTPAEKHHAAGMLACSIIGSMQTVREGLKRFVADTQADELMIVSAVFDPALRQRSIELIAEAAA
ncbi:LLM class flavin-dependent oxidoreductase [Ideonella sp. DXS29W]|uniref:LLM class flavin-dependent oxidoreductase n=1 Tax=Ideonella lacteola TaxID=2984193 RepID=A0ABU9BTJ6_9BURK